MTAVVSVHARRGAALAGLLLALLLVAALGLALWAGLEQLLAHWGDVPLNITIDGEPVAQGLQLGAIDAGTRLALVIGLLVLLLLLALVLPVLLVLLVAAVLAALLLSAAVAVGAPVIVVGAVMLGLGIVVVLPVLLLARLLRRLLRGGRPRADTPPALPAPPAPHGASATIKP